MIKALSLVWVPVMALILPTPDVRHIDIQLLDEDALIMGGGGIPTPSETYVQTATDLYLVPNGFTPTADYGNVQVLTTPESAALNSYTEGAQDLVNQVASMQLGDTMYVFGYSQSSDLTAIAASQLQGDAVQFALVGDSANPNGGLLTMFDLLSLYGATAATPGAYGDLPTDIYTLEYDGWADFPQYVSNPLAIDNALAGQAFEHLAYLGLTPAEIASASTETVGSVTYHDIPSSLLPLLAGDLFGGPLGRALYDLEQPVDQVEVDLGYGHLDQIVNGQVIPDGFNTGSPAIEVTANWGSPDISEAAIQQTLTEASNLGWQDFMQALIDPNYQGPAYDAAIEMTQLVDAGVNAGVIDSSLASILNLILTP